MRHRRPVVLAAAVALLALVAAGCGGSGGGSSTSPKSATAQILAYARCMRSHGVSAFPDPSSSGQIAKPEVVAARNDDPSRFDLANTICQRLLPYGGGNGETPAQIAQDWKLFEKFARCMRSNGVPNWPDPSARSTTDKRPAFNITAVGLNGTSPQLRAKAQECASQFHLGGLPPAH